MKKKTDIDALNCLKEKEKKAKKRKIKDVNLQIDDAVKNKKNKTMIEFNKSECNSIKSVVVKGNASNNKLSIKSFIYDMIDAFCFPNQKIQEIYNYYQIERCFLYQNLNDTDSTSLFFCLFVRSDVLLLKVKLEILFLNV